MSEPVKRIMTISDYVRNFKLLMDLAKLYQML